MEPFRPGGAGPARQQLGVDPLTELPNEHCFRQYLPEAFRQAREHEANAALLVASLDNLVGINARHGRSGGDEALRAAAYVLENHRGETANASSSRRVFRLGGPIFAYYAADCSAPHARALAEQLHEGVQRSDLFLEPITVSIGLVNLYEFFLEEGTAAQIARRLEQAALRRLQLAERHGTNTICDTSSLETVASGPQRTVLVVEPEPISLELLLRALQAGGLTVAACEDGESALSLIEATAPGVILCEAMTPRLNGFAIRERLRANAQWSGIPFILMSHRKNEELIRRAVELDIRHYFRKPLSVTEVVGLILNLTRRAAAPGSQDP